MTDATGTAEYLRRRIQERRELPPPAACRQLREACDLPVRDLATCVGVSPAAVRQWERGDRTPRGEARRRYIEALRVLKESLPRGPAAGAA